MEHTKGPWIIIKDNKDYYIDSSEGMNIALIGCEELCKYENKANALLIVSAPELLQALKHIENMLEVQQAHRNITITSAIQYCKEVIAKVEGK